MTQTKKELKKKYGYKSKYLGKGSYGTIYLYIKEENDIKNEVAIKKVKYNEYNKFRMKLDLGDALVMQNVREISVMKYLDGKHPNIMGLVDVMIKPDYANAYLVMSYMNHGNLKNYRTRSYRLNKIPIDVTLLKSIVYQTMCGLSYIHSMDIIHRDITSPNIFINNKEEVKIGDFGLSLPMQCTVYGKSTDVTALFWRAPEIIYNISTYDSSVDIWSLGVVIYEMVTGNDLFPVKFDRDSSLAYRKKNMGDKYKAPPRYAWWQEENSLQLLTLITQLLGTPTKKTYPDLPPIKDQRRKIHYSHKYQGNPRKIYDDFNKHLESPKLAKEYYDLVMGMLQIDPKNRKTAYQLLRSNIFDSIRNPSLEYEECDCLSSLYLMTTFALTSPNTSFPNTKHNVLDFILSVGLNLNAQLRYLSRAIYLHFLVFDKVNTKNQKLYASGCMYLAFTYTTGLFMHGYTFDDFLPDSPRLAFTKMTANILKAIDYDLNIAGSVDFIHKYVILSVDSYEVSFLAQLISMLLYYTSLASKSPPNIALMSIMISCLYYNTPFKYASLIPKEYNPKTVIVYLKGIKSKQAINFFLSKMGGGQTKSVVKDRPKWTTFLKSLESNKLKIGPSVNINLCKSLHRRLQYNTVLSKQEKKQIVALSNHPEIQYAKVSSQVLTKIYKSHK